MISSKFLYPIDFIPTICLPATVPRVPLGALQFPRPRLPYFRNRLCMEAACWKFGLDTKDIYLLFQDSNWVFEGFNWVPNVDARNCLFCFLWNTEQVQKLPRFRKLGGTRIGILPLDLSDSLVNDWNITKFDRFCLFSAHVCALYRYWYLYERVRISVSNVYPIWKVASFERQPFVYSGIVPLQRKHHEHSWTRWFYSILLPFIKQRF